MRLRVLIVEDEEHNYILLKEYMDILSFLEFDITWVENGYDAINSVNNDIAYDVVLLDVKLPGLNGYDVAKQIKAIDSKLYIIAQTAHAQPEDEAQCYKAGCDDYLSKPFTIDELEEVFHRLLKREKTHKDALSA